MTKTRKELKDEITTKYQVEIERIETAKTLLIENYQKKLEEMEDSLTVEKLKLEAMEKVREN